MKFCFAAIAAAALIGTALPAGAEEIGVGMGPVGVTVGLSVRIKPMRPRVYPAA